MWNKGTFTYLTFSTAHSVYVRSLVHKACPTFYRFNFFYIPEIDYSMTVTCTQHFTHVYSVVFGYDTCINVDI